MSEYGHFIVFQNCLDRPPAVEPLLRGRPFAPEMRSFKRGGLSSGVELKSLHLCLDLHSPAANYRNNSKSSYFNSYTLTKEK